MSDGEVVQATVRAFDPATRDVELLTDDGTPLHVPGAVVDPAVRLLRLGQRVHLRREPGQPGGSGPVAALTLSTLPLNTLPLSTLPLSTLPLSGTA